MSSAAEPTHATSIRPENTTADLDRPPTIAPLGKRRGAGASLWRLRYYLLPFRTRFVVMAVSALLGIGTTIVTPLITKAVVDGPVATSDHRGLWVLGLVALGVGIAEAVLTFIRRWVVAAGTNGTENGIRLELYAKLQRLPTAFHDRWASGQLLSRMMSDLSTIRRFLGFGMLFIVMNLVQILVVTALLLSMYWPLGLVVLVAIVPITVACLRNQKAYTRLSRRIQDQTGDVASSVEESAHAIRVIKAFGRGRWTFRTFDERSVRLYATSLERVALSARFWTFLEIIPGAALIIVLGLGAVAAAQERLTLGTLVAFVTLLLSLVWPVSAMGFLLAMAQESFTAADRIAEIFDTENTITDGDRELRHPRGHLRLNRVGFRFADADSDALHDIDLDLRPGETVAIVGATGSGKTVLTNLIPRLYDVTAGSITIDGVDIRDLRLSRLRSIVATAFEDPTLFSMSARENLTLGRPEATEEEIASAVDVAQAHFVYDLPWGLDTRIGEQGLSLSGGQRQRLALARAVLARPAVLVLDDTLSALDIHTEALVEEALKRVLVGVTGIVVAHRASTVLLADRVALMEDGTITHIGTHGELLARVPEYRDLLSAELNAEELIA